MTTTLQQLADLVSGDVVGDPATVIRAAKTLQDADDGDITFVENDKKIDRLLASKASAAVIGVAVSTIGKAAIKVKDPLAAFITIVKHLQGFREETRTGIDSRACVDPSVKIGTEPTIMPFAVVGAETEIGDRCRIYPGVVIGRDCKIGDDVTIYPNAVLYDRSEIQCRSIIHANAVIGADGFGYRMQGGKHIKVPQLGSVIIGSDVEIGAATTIDRGTFQATRIGDGTKIDNLVQIGHNCRIGKHNILVSQVGIAGSCTTGDYVVMGGQVGIADHVNIGAGVQLGAKSGVISDLAPGERWIGHPAMPDAAMKRIWVVMNHLPEMRRDLNQIKKQLGMVERAA